MAIRKALLKLTSHALVTMPHMSYYGHIVYKFCSWQSLCGSMIVLGNQISKFSMWGWRVCGYKVLQIRLD